MKNYFLKGWASLIVLAMVAMVTMVSCDDDPEPDPIEVEDGLYIKGAGTALTELDGKGLMSKARNEVLNDETTAPRATLYEMYIAVEGGSDGFHISNVSGGVETVWGPGADFAKVLEADLDVEEPSNGLWKGSYEESATAFTVEEDGLYYVALDTELGMIVVAKVVWGLIGGATPGGWSDDTEMTATFDLNSMEFMVEDVTMLENDWKFRFSGGWKIILSTDTPLTGYPDKTGVKVNTNLGEAVNALVAGGGNISNSEYAVYKFTMTWTLGSGHAATQVKTGEAEPLPEYYDELYIIGGALNMEDSDSNDTPDGWQWELTDVQMIPVHSNPNAFWKIVWLEAAEGIKFSPAKNWDAAFGVTTDATSALGDHLIGSDNVPAPAEAGYYMVWVDTDRDSVSITTPEVYLLGDAIGTWDVPNTEGLFTVDNPNVKLTLTKDLAAAELRMCAWHKWHGDWWQSEFMILDGMIEFRGAGDDQERVSVVAGTTTIDLNFKEETGTITQ